MVMIGIIVCNKIFMYSSFKLHFVYTVPFQPERDDESEMTMNSKAAITITYCSQCNWMLRASWMAQELLHTFSTDIASVTLVPGTGGIFTIEIDGRQIWERKQDGGFPDAAELKRRVRDVCFPEKALGHVDKPANPT